MTDTLCGTHHHLGPRCIKPKGHNGTHQADHGYQWTDESDAAGAKALADAETHRRWLYG